MKWKCTFQCISLWSETPSFRNHLCLTCTWWPSCRPTLSIQVTSRVSPSLLKKKKGGSPPVRAVQRHKSMRCLKVGLFIPLLLKVWSAEWQHQHHLGTNQKWRNSVPIPDLRNQICIWRIPRWFITTLKSKKHFTGSWFIIPHYALGSPAGSFKSVEAGWVPGQTERIHISGIALAWETLMWGPGISNSLE